MAKPLQAGDGIPSFSLPDQRGEQITEKDLLGATSVIYFYPKDCTPGCTKQACDFRDRMPDFSKEHVKIIGVSPDGAASHTDFIEKYDLNFTLLTDADHKVSEAFGVWKEKVFMGKKYMGIERTTFIVDEKGIIRWIERSVKVAGHGKRVFEAIENGFQ